MKKKLRAGDLPPVIVPGKWHHIALVSDQSEVRMYLDGRRYWTLPRNRPPHQEAGEGFWIGAQPVPVIGYHYEGKIDEIRLSARACYRENFQPPRRLKVEAETLALYHCDEDTEGKLIDSSGRGHHGIISGARWVPLGESQK